MIRSLPRSSRLSTRCEATQAHRHLLHSNPAFSRSHLRASQHCPTRWIRARPLLTLMAWQEKHLRLNPHFRMMQE